MFCAALTETCFKKLVLKKRVSPLSQKKPAIFFHGHSVLCKGCEAKSSRPIFPDNKAKWEKNPKIVCPLEERKRSPENSPLSLPKECGRKRSCYFLSHSPPGQRRGTLME
ncbi:hypothetical protein NPIL_175611 [Nephila pilipes]|uniref:Uncharacterized protein n=1 Tax=Nephila pilipes TaxID=299642 RepID=A0A8X6QX79_NEPPI|nr:hypothetical protein NPIL_175611 [Nephila pilipes]